MSTTRQIVLDTETTGLEPRDGHRIIEIGCIEIVNRRITSNRYHQYINPEREVDEGAVEVHGLTSEFLAEKPKFADIAREFIEFIKGAELVIHNAPFDVGFIDAELGLLGADWRTTADYCGVFDTLVLARDMHPGQRNSLDALCRRYEIDNTHRDLHGALLDAELLADVYLLMTGGQVDLSLQSVSVPVRASAVGESDLSPSAAVSDLPVVSPTAEELEAHRDLLDWINAESGEQCLWLKEDSLA